MPGNHGKGCKLSFLRQQSLACGSRTPLQARLLRPGFYHWRSSPAAPCRSAFGTVLLKRAPGT